MVAKLLKNSHLATEQLKIESEPIWFLTTCSIKHRNKFLLLVYTILIALSYISFKSGMFTIKFSPDDYLVADSQIVRDYNMVQNASS